MDITKVHADDLFQSTLPRGERQIVDSTLIGVMKFQSTLPRGERLTSNLALHSFHNFNPRSHEGSDVPASVRTVNAITDFNPRSHEGSDPDPVCVGHGYVISIHAPTRGATQSVVNKGW